jgi:hypothetical protein
LLLGTALYGYITGRVLAWIESHNEFKTES